MNDDASTIDESDPAWARPMERATNLDPYQRRVRQSLRGRTILNVRFAEDDSRGSWGRCDLLIFDTDQGEVRWRADGECCSTSWFETVDVAPGRVLDVSILLLGGAPLNGVPTVEDCDRVKYYGISITTTGGRGVVDFRNDSNGYYGGYVVVEGELDDDDE